MNTIILQSIKDTYDNVIDKGVLMGKDTSLVPHLTTSRMQTVYTRLRLAGKREGFKGATELEAKLPDLFDKILYSLTFKSTKAISMEIKEAKDRAVIDEILNG